MCLSRWLDRLNGLTLIVLVFILTSQSPISPETAVAWHEHEYPFHIYSMHSSGIYEETCVMMLTGSMSFSTAKTRIVQTLYYDNTSSDWDDLAGGKIYFFVFNDDCNNLPDSIYQNTEVEYQVVSDATASTECNSGGPPVSCAYFEILDQWTGSHWDWRYGYAVVQASRLSGSAFTYHHLINHETGHILGLADPGVGEPHYQCMYSVMHSAYYGCSDREWPTYSDRTAVEAIANN